jgi:hypothetical protein
MTNESSLDPRSANVGFCWGVIGDYPNGEYNIGRVYYWYDPDGASPTVEDWDLRQRHREISDADWKRLFTEAFDRGERRFASLEWLFDDESAAACPL